MSPQGAVKAKLIQFQIVEYATGSTMYALDDDGRLWWRYRGSAGWGHWQALDDGEQWKSRT